MPLNFIKILADPFCGARRPGQLPPHPSLRSRFLRERAGVQCLIYHHLRASFSMTASRGRTRGGTFGCLSRRLPLSLLYMLAHMWLLLGESHILIGPAHCWTTRTGLLISRLQRRKELLPHRRERGLRGRHQLASIPVHPGHLLHGGRLLWRRASAWIGVPVSLFPARRRLSMICSTFGVQRITVASYFCSLRSYSRVKQRKLLLVVGHRGLSRLLSPLATYICPSGTVIPLFGFPQERCCLAVLGSPISQFCLVAIHRTVHSSYARKNCLVSLSSYMSGPRQSWWTTQNGSWLRIFTGTKRFRLGCTATTRHGNLQWRRCQNPPLVHVSCWSACPRNCLRYIPPPMFVLRLYTGDITLSRMPLPQCGYTLSCAQLLFLSHVSCTYSAKVCHYVSELFGCLVQGRKGSCGLLDLRGNLHTLWR